MDIEELIGAFLMLLAIGAAAHTVLRGVFWLITRLRGGPPDKSPGVSRYLETARADTNTKSPGASRYLETARADTEEKILRSGLEGELTVQSWLSQLSGEHVVFNQVQVPDLTGKSRGGEIDFVVVGPGGVHLVEAKNNLGEIRVGDDGQWTVHGPNGSVYPMRNPVSQIKRQTYLLRQYLKAQGFGAPLKRVIALVRASSLRGYRSEVPVVLGALELTSAIQQDEPVGYNTQRVIDVMRELTRQQAGQADPSLADMSNIQENKLANLLDERVASGALDDDEELGGYVASGALDDDEELGGYVARRARRARRLLDDDNPTRGSIDISSAYYDFNEELFHSDSDPFDDD